MNIKLPTILLITSVLTGCDWFNSEPGLAYHQSFEKATEGEIVPGKIGNALHISARKPGVKFALPDGLIGQTGCVEFWAKIDGGDGRCTDTFAPQLFTLYANNDDRISIGFSTNNGHGNSGLCFRYWGLAFTASHKGCRAFPFSDILKSAPAGWHHYALTWNTAGVKVDTPNQDNPPTLVCFIDGRPCLFAGNAKTFKESFFLDQTKWRNTPITLDFSCLLRSNVGYTIDEFKLWTTDKTEFDVSPNP